VARPPDLQRKRELLDSVVVYLADQGLADTTLRPMAAALGVSINRLVHHFGSKDELITAALARAIDQQIEVQRAWLKRSPKLTQVELYRRWWKWLSTSHRNLALVRLNYEAATLEPSVTGLAGDVRADQIGVWRHDVEQRLVSEGLKPEHAALEASLIKATFTGLVMDLFATGETRRLTQALDEWLDRLDQDLRAHTTRVVPARPGLEIPPCANTV
jgi:AcrR family transcriptional regulator